MRTILLLRHAQAKLPDSSGKDFDRRLNKSGENVAALQVQRILKAGLRPDFILCSPATRTLQTAEIFSAAINKAFPENLLSPYAAAPLYHANAAGYIREIREQVPAAAQCLLVVGHNPSIEDLVLLFNQNQHDEDNQFTGRLGDGFPTAALALIELSAVISELTAYNASLKALYLPHEN